MNAYYRSYESEKKLVILNITEATIACELEKLVGDQYEVLIQNYLEQDLTNLLPYEAKIYKIAK